MIMVGSGAQHAHAEVLQLAELLQAPVVPLRSGRGVVSDEHYLGFTCAAGFKRWRDTDVLIAIGTRLELQWFRWPQPPKLAPIINIDIDPTQVPRIKPAVAIVGDSRTATRALIEAVMRSGKARASRREEFEALKARTRAEIQKVQPHMAYLDVIRAVLPRDGFFVEEICQAGFTSILRLSGLRAAHLRHLRLPGHARLRLLDRARRQGRATRTRRCCRSRATAASCSACRSWRPPCSTASASSPSSSTTTPSAT